MPSGSSVQKVTSYPGWFIPVTVVLGLLGLAGAFAGYDGLSGVVPNPVLGWGGLGGAGGAIVLVLLLRALTMKELTVDSEGLGLRAPGGKVTRIQWSEEHDFLYLAVDSSETPGAEKASVRTADGRRIDIDDIRSPDNQNIRIPRLVDQYSTTANWPRIKGRLQGGEEVKFGVVRINNQKLELGSHSFPLDRPLSLQVEKGLIRVGAEGNWTSSGVSVLDVANYPCLLRAIGQVTQTRAPL